MNDKSKIILEWQLIPNTDESVWKRKRLHPLDPPETFATRQVGKTTITAQQQALINLFFEGTWAASVGPELSLSGHSDSKNFIATVFPDGRKLGKHLQPNANPDIQASHSQQSPPFLSIEEAKRWADARLREMGCVLVEDRNLGPLV